MTLVITPNVNVTWCVGLERRYNLKRELYFSGTAGINLLFFKYFSLSAGERHKIICLRHVKTPKASTFCGFCRWERLVDERGQRRAATLVQADNKTTGTRITTPYNRVEEKSVSGTSKRHVARKAEEHNVSVWDLKIGSWFSLMSGIVGGGRRKHVSFV